ncbi:peptide chain release factor 2 [Patescibacteria group bacterium]|nr:peptide chain release factor 2 [Patescibacteria group bacterium]
MDNSDIKIEELEKRVHHLMTVFDIVEKEKKIKELESRNDWKLGKEIADLRQEVDAVRNLEKKIQQGQIENLAKEIEKEEIKIFLSGKYDKNNAIMEIFSGAGGIDAQDWATILIRMFERYCERKGFQTKVIHQSFGEAGGPEGRIGTKSATLEIKGNYVYGFLKKETGVHRLVRQSPFSAKKLRHTSFALVEVLPEIGKKEQEEIKIKDEDLRLDTFRSSGPGGQYVNKRESAVRITHIPTGITVSSQSERLQGLNRDKAMKVLFAKLYQLKEAEKKEKLKEIKGGITSASWGNQIRSYVLHPYKLVKDLRTGVETSNVEDVLDGNLDQFIEAEIK